MLERDPIKYLPLSTVSLGLKGCMWQDYTFESKEKRNDEQVVGGWCLPFRFTDYLVLKEPDAASPSAPPVPVLGKRV